MKSGTIKLLDGFFDRNPELKIIENNVHDAIETLIPVAKKGTILVCGNGGSAADCEHLSGELVKSFALERTTDKEYIEKLLKFGKEGKYIAENVEGGIKCIPLPSLMSAISAFSNDKKADLSYAQLVGVFGGSGDALIAISTSGNAENVYYAAIAAKAKGMKVIALTGKTGGKLKAAADISILCPSDKTYQIQEIHLPLYHLICMCLEKEIFS